MFFDYDWCQNVLCIWYFEKWCCFVINEMKRRLCFRFYQNSSGWSDGPSTKRVVRDASVIDDVLLKRSKQKASCHIRFVQLGLHPYWLWFIVNIKILKYNVLNAIIFNVKFALMLSGFGSGEGEKAGQKFYVFRLFWKKTESFCWFLGKY